MTDENETQPDANDETIRLDDGEEVVELNKQDVVELNEFLEHVQIVILTHEQRLGQIEAFLTEAFAKPEEESEKPDLHVVGEAEPLQSDDEPDAS